MANPTTNYGFVLPQPSDLVTDLPADFDIALQGVDTRLKALQPGTTLGDLAYSSATANTNTRLPIGANGKVLGVVAGVPAWVDADPLTILDAKGDLITATAADTPARLAVGANGETLVADSSASTGLRYQGNFAAGKNKIINGDFGIWQRGTTGLSVAGGYNADRWLFYADGSGATQTVTQQTFTAGAAPIAGYEGQFYWQYQATVAGTGGTERSMYTRLEDVRTFAGQTVTLSFFAKADAARTITGFVRQNFGSGGSASVDTAFTSQSVTTSWARYSATITLPSISGKTIGTSSYLQPTLQFPINVTETIQIWGVQLEAGSVATAFQTATGTLQGELAACQRYYYRIGGSYVYEILGVGNARSTTVGDVVLTMPVSMRTAPSSIDFSSIALLRDFGSSPIAITSVAFSGAGKNTAISGCTVASGLTAGQNYYTVANNSTSAYLAVSAEL